MKYKNMHEIQKIRSLKPYKKYLMYGHGMSGLLMPWIPLDIMESQGWNGESIYYGIERLKEISEDGSRLYPVYSKEECRQDRYNKDINVIHFPAVKKEDTSKPYIIVISGGAYQGVCSLVESYPVAARFNELGYQVFALTYHVGGRAIMPKPLDDLAAAIRYIDRNADDFGVEAGNYIVCGFSAGANVTSLWGTFNHGYKKYDLPKPKALFPIYTVVTSRFYASDDKLTDSFLTICFGKQRSGELIQDYDVDTHADEDYPPTYLCCNKDDPLVNYQNSVIMKECLDKLGVPAVLELGEHGGHGFGEGRGLEVEGWYKRAIDFAEGIN